MDVIANFFYFMAVIVGALWIFTETKYGKRWIRREFDGEMEDVEDTHFTFTEEQKERIKRIINKHYTEEGCDTCGHYMSCSGGGAFGPPCSNCDGGENYMPDNDTRKSNDQMFEEIEKIINE